jgi:hypothetical protein
MLLPICVVSSLSATGSPNRGCSSARYSNTTRQRSERLAANRPITPIYDHPTSELARLLSPVVDLLASLAIGSLAPAEELVILAKHELRFVALLGQALDGGNVGFAELGCASKTETAGRDVVRYLAHDPPVKRRRRGGLAGLVPQSPDDWRLQEQSLPLFFGFCLIPSEILGICFWWRTDASVIWNLT